MTDLSFLFNDNYYEKHYLSNNRNYVERCIFLHKLAKLSRKQFSCMINFPEKITDIGNIFFSEHINKYIKYKLDNRYRNTSNIINNNPYKTILNKNRLAIVLLFIVIIMQTFNLTIIEKNSDVKIFGSISLICLVIISWISMQISSINDFDSIYLTYFNNKVSQPDRTMFLFTEFSSIKNKISYYLCCCNKRFSCSEQIN